MNPAQLLDHFDRISEAPDAIPRLRRFILDLAVRGQLVEQDANDEPASELLKRIQVEKARLVESGEIRKETALPPVQPDGMRLGVPSGWAWMRVRQATSGRGQIIPDRDFTYIDVTAIDKEAGRVADAKVISASDAPSRARKVVRKGDVIYSCVRPYLLNVAVIDSDIAPAPIASTAFAVLNGFGLIVPKYLWVVLRSSFMIECVEAKMRGQSYPAINDEDFALLPLPLSPLPEQHRIVAKVEELMALCDRLEAAQAERERRRNRLASASLQRLTAPADTSALREHASFHLRHLARLTTHPDQISALRETILNLAVRGQLLPQNPNDEPASLLHDRLKSARAKMQEAERSRSRRDILPSAARFFADVFPPCWVVTNFDNVNTIVSGVAKGKKLSGFKTASYPYLRVANVQRGYLDLDIVKELEIRPSELERYRLRRGDVLMTEGGDWDKLGRAAIWNDEIHNCIHQNHIYRIRSADAGELLPAWIALFANSSLGRSYFEEASKQTTNLASINMTQLRSCPLPLPATSEQERIVAKVDELMALCDRLEAQLKRAQTESRRLLEAVFDHALERAG